MTAFANAENSLPVRCPVISSGKDAGYCEPDAEGLAWRMRWTHEHREEAAAMGRRGERTCARGSGCARWENGGERRARARCERYRGGSGRDWWTSISEGRTLGRAVVSMRRSILDISGLVVVVAQRTGPLLTRCGKATWISNRARVGTRARARRLKQCERASTRPVVHRSSFARRTRSAHRPRASDRRGRSRGSGVLGRKESARASTSRPIANHGRRHVPVLPCCGRYSPCSLSWRLRVRSPIARRPSSATRAIFSARSVRRVARPRRLPCSLGLPRGK